MRFIQNGSAFGELAFRFTRPQVRLTIAVLANIQSLWQLVNPDSDCSPKISQ